MAWHERAVVAAVTPTGKGGLIVDLQVVPRSSRAAVGPAVGNRLKVAVMAAAVDGAANAAVIEVIARAFGVRRQFVQILRGETGKRKTVRIEGASQARLDELWREGWNAT